MPEYSSTFVLTILGISNVLIIITFIKYVFGVNLENGFTIIYWLCLAVIYIINHILFLVGDKAYSLVMDYSKKYGKKHLYRLSIIIIPYTFLSIVATILILSFGMVP